MEPRHILLGTTNAAKLERLTWLTAGLPVLVHPPRELGIQPPAEPEQGTGFAEIAAAKAIGWSRRARGMLALASDGGLRIPALGGGWNELLTRRNAGDKADAARRVEHLLSLMRGVAGGERACEWHEAIALASDGRLLAGWTASGSGGVIVERWPGGAPPGEFWTESMRMHLGAGKLYRDMSDEELARYDTVWPALRDQVRLYFLTA